MIHNAAMSLNPKLFDEFAKKKKIMLSYMPSGSRELSPISRLPCLRGLKDQNLYCVLTVSRIDRRKRCDMPAIKQK